MRRLGALGILILAACNGSRGAGNDDPVLNVITGTRFDLAKIVVPGQVTVVKFWSEQ